MGGGVRNLATDLRHGDSPVAGRPRRVCVAPPQSRIAFADDLAAQGDRVALIDAEGRRLSYAGLAEAADRAAARLPAQRTLLALTLAPTFDAVALYLAALRARHPVILLDGSDPVGADRIAAQYGAWRPEAPGSAATTDLHADLAVLLSTSGTTGSAKLVRLSATNIASNAAAIAEYLGIGADDRAIASLPFHYSYGLSVLHSHLAAGAAMVLTDASVSDEAFWTLCAAQGVTHLAGVPYSYDLFERMRLRERDLPALRTLTQAGGRLPPELVARYADWAAGRGVRFFVMYGQTEATARIAFLPPERALTDSGCIGIAIPGGTLALEQADGSDAGDGPGELVYRGPNVMMGYALTPADLARGAELTALRTGDLAERTEGGLFRIVGRLSRFSKLFGLRVSHDEIERHLAEQGVTALVSGDDQALAIVCAPAVPPRLAAGLAARFHLPEAVFRTAAVPELPRFASGKPDYAAARALIAAAPVAAAPRAGNVRAAFAACFPDRAIGADDSFAGLGGDSLNYVTFALALEDLIGEPPENWPELSVAQLEMLAGAAPAPRRWWKHVDSDMVVRALAITSVVLVHTRSGAIGGVSMGGGALALMLLFGFNMARFQLPRLIAGEGGGVLRGFLLRVMLPYLAIVILYGVAKHRLDLPSLLMVSSFTGRFGGSLEPYWFLEAAFQGLALLTALFAVPAVRRAAADDPTRFAWLLVAGACALKGVGALLLDQAHLQHRSVDANLAYVAIGWAAAVVPGLAARLALVALAAGLTMLDWDGATTRTGWALATLGLVLFVPRLKLPRWLATPVVRVAQASFAIYLTHLLVVNLVEYKLKLVAPVPTVIGALLLGIAVNAAIDWLARRRPGGRAGAMPPVA